MRTGAVFVLVLSLVGVSPLAPRADGAQRTEPRVTLFGDSVAGSIAYVPEARAILQDGVDMRFELAPCRGVAAIGCPYMGTRPPSALTVVQASTPASLGDIVVVDVGYNEDAVNYGTDMASLGQALISRGVGHVVWVTLRQKTDNYAKIDAIVESQAKRWP